MTQPDPLPALIPEFMCSNVDDSVAFYTQVLGFHVHYKREETRFAMVAREGAYIMLDEYSPDSLRPWIAGPLEKPFGRGMNMEIAVTDAEALYQSCVAAKASLFLDIEDKWYRVNESEHGVRQFIVLDPDGYMLRFSQSMGKRPAQL